MPLIQKLTDIDVSQIWYVDDTAAGGQPSLLVGSLNWPGGAGDTKTEVFGGHGMGCFI